MIRTMMISLVTAAAVAVIPVTSLLAAEPDGKPHTVACLKKAAEMNQAGAALGQLAGDRGANPRVRQFGLQIASAHKRLNEEVQGLATTKGVQLSSELNEEHKHKVKEFSQLSGHAFDREYMGYILRDHQNSANEFDEHMLMVEDPDLLHWIARTLPLLRAHVEEARGIKYAMQTTP
jgi:putative membrane protein